MADINKDISAYEVLRPTLESNAMGKWVLVHDEKLEGIFESFEAAAESAVKKFAQGPYLIRQIGAPAITLPASVMFRSDHDTHN